MLRKYLSHTCKTLCLRVVGCRLTIHATSHSYVIYDLTLEDWRTIDAHLNVKLKHTLSCEKEPHYCCTLRDRSQSMGESLCHRMMKAGLASLLPLKQIHQLK
jgi:hypothetical protein